jgi:hypothetical protein
MDESRKSKFEGLLNDTKDEIHRLENQIEEELAAIKLRLADLQNQKKAQTIIYGGYCQLLDVENEFDTEEEDEEEELE